MIALYRRVVERLLWFIPIRPGGTQLNVTWTKLKHVLRYAKGILDYSYDLSPKLTLTGDVTTDVATYVGSDR
eukprot:5798649-Lingulodinium_polyedra.AAC.1